jgi:mannose-6-phosphate isomerase
LNNIFAEPAKLKPKFFSYIWGGKLLKEYLNKDIPSDDIGESWEVSAHPKGQSVIVSGPASGMALGEYVSGEGFYGCMPAEKFPLLIKLLGAEDNLSVQVHPGDSNCRPGEAGKAEAWYVLACKPDAELIYDINCSTEEFAAAVAEGKLSEKLRHVAVRPDVVLDIPDGMVHALTAGIVVYEVQQNSETTYRLYDWGRVEAATGKPRELHIDAALAVIKPGEGTGSAEPHIQLGSDFCKQVLVNNAHFALEKIDLHGNYKDDWFNNFAAYTVIEGTGSVLKGGETLFTVALGDSFISPAAAGAVELAGNMTLLKSHVPPRDAYREWLEKH